MFDKSRICLLTVDVPLELGGGFGSEGGAVHVDLVANVVAGKSPADDRALVGKFWKRRKKIVKKPIFFTGLVFSCLFLPTTARTASLNAVWKSGASPEISQRNWPVVFRSTLRRKITVSVDWRS